MNLGKILGSISPAFGMASGKGLFGNSDLLSGLGGMGMGGLLGLLLSGHGEGGEGGQAPQPQASPVQNSAQMIGNLGLPDGAGYQTNPVYSQEPVQRWGNYGGQSYFGGRNPIGQNALGRFMGGLFQ